MIVKREAPLERLMVSMHRFPGATKSTKSKHKSGGQCVHFGSSSKKSKLRKLTEVPNARWHLTHHGYGKHAETLLFLVIGAGGKRRQGLQTPGFQEKAFNE